MKVIFLDHDGVTCLQNNWGTRYKKQKDFYLSEDRPKFKSDIPVNLRFDDFDKKAINVLNRILSNTDAEIICSSDWRLYSTLEEMQEYYLSQGILKAPLGFTPKLFDFDKSSYDLFTWRGQTARVRCLEIKKWLGDNKVNSWVVVDDLNMSNEYLQPGLDNFVLTPKSDEGIKQTGIYKKIVNFLI